MREYESTYDLPYPLDRFQELIDPTECEQPVSEVCGSENCEPRERCSLFVQALSNAQCQEFVIPSPLPEPKPCLISGEVEIQKTNQMILVVQQADWQVQGDGASSKALQCE